MSLGFKKAYDENGDARCFFKYLTALPFVQIEFFVTEYIKLKDIYFLIIGKIWINFVTILKTFICTTKFIP